jgi:uncharacterized spore protein YtfJ
MDVSEVLAGARDALTVRRVVGDPYERDGVTVIPVARVRGGGGGGDDGITRDDKPHPAGGGGFGLEAAPVGAYVIRDGEVAWEPAVDVNRLGLGGMVVAVVALLTLRSVVRALTRRERG